MKRKRTKKHVWIFATGKPACGAHVNGHVSWSPSHKADTPLVMFESYYGISKNFCKRCVKEFFDIPAITPYPASASAYLKPVYTDEITVLT